MHEYQTHIIIFYVYLLISSGSVFLVILPLVYVYDITKIKPRAQYESARCSPFFKNHSYISNFLSFVLKCFLYEVNEW